MRVYKDLPDAVGKTPLIRLEEGVRDHRLRNLRQGRVPEPGPVGEGPGGALRSSGTRWRRGSFAPAGPSSRARRATPASAWRWSATRDGLQDRDRDPRDPEPGEEGHAAPLRRRPASRSRRCPTATPTTTCTYSGRLAEELARPSLTARSGRTSSTTSPTAQAHIDSTGPEIWEQTGGKIDGFICAVGTGGTLAGVGMALTERKTRRQDRPRRSDGRGALPLLRPWRAEGRGLARSPRASARAGSPPTSTTCRSTSPTRSPTRRRCRSSSTSCRRRGCAWAARPASTSRARSGSPVTWGRGIPSSPCSATMARRYQSQDVQPDLPQGKGPAGPGLAGPAIRQIRTDGVRAGMNARPAPVLLAGHPGLR